MVLASSTVSGIAGAQSTAPTFVSVNEHLVSGARANGYVLLADVDGDGRLDAVSSDLILRTITVSLHQADRTWGPPVATAFTAPGVDYEPSFALADLNEDGRADIVVSADRWNPQGVNGPNILVRFGSPNGQFVNQINLNNQPGAQFPAYVTKRGMALADVNHDGHVDILGKTSGTPGNGYSQGISVMAGDGAGGFGPPIESGTGAYQFLLLGDVSGDGHLDAVTVNDVGTGSHANTAAYVNLGDGAGQFAYVGTQMFDCRLSTGSGNARAFLADVDGDGLADLVMFGRHGSQTGAGGIYVRKSIGGGAFSPLFRVISTSISTILLADLNGDARPDIVRCDTLPQGTNQILVNNGSGDFSTSVPFPACTSGREARDVSAGNLRGNSQPEVVIMTVSDVLEDLGLQTFENTTPLIAVGTPFCFGDGSSLACPCGNVSGPAMGCPSSVSAAGARLEARGASTVSSDSLELVSTFVPNGPGLYYQGANATDISFGDGKLCAGTGIVRLGLVFAAGNTSTYPAVTAPVPIRSAGFVAAGDSRSYQLWYRDSTPGFCTSFLFNLTNGVALTWSP